MDQPPVPQTRIVKVMNHPKCVIEIVFLNALAKKDCQTLQLVKKFFSRRISMSRQNGSVRCPQGSGADSYLRQLSYPKAAGKHRKHAPMKSADPIVNILKMEETSFPTMPFERNLRHIWSRYHFLNSAYFADFSMRFQSTEIDCVCVGFSTRANTHER